jgi:hypothetical protein
MKKKDERKLHVAEMGMLRWMCGVTRIDKVRNDYIRQSQNFAQITEKLKGYRLSWYGQVMRREENVTRIDHYSSHIFMFIRT